MLRKIATSFFIFFFSIAFFFALLTTGLRMTVLNPGFVLGTIKDARLYDQVIPQALSIVLNQMSKEAGLKLPVSEDKIAAVLTYAAPPAWIEANAAPLIQDLLEYVNGDRATLAAKVDLREVKTRLRAALARDRALAPYRELVREIPDQINFAELTKQNQPAFDQARDYVVLFKKIQIGLVVASVILAILIILINLGHWDELARRVAASLLGTAVPLLALSALGYWYAPRLLLKLPTDAAALAPLATTFTRQAVVGALLWGGALAGVAIILFIIAPRLKRKTI